MAQGTGRKQRRSWRVVVTRFSLFAATADLKRRSWGSKLLARRTVNKTFGLLNQSRKPGWKVSKSKKVPFWDCETGFILSNTCAHSELVGDMIWVGTLVERCGLGCICKFQMSIPKHNLRTLPFEIVKKRKISKLRRLNSLLQGGQKKDFRR